MASGRRSRLQRKARRVEKNAFERELDEGLGGLKRERDTKLHAANAEYDAAVAVAVKARAAARSEADDAYKHDRDRLIQADRSRRNEGGRGMTWRCETDWRCWSLGFTIDFRDGFEFALGLGPFYVNVER